jgi:hypothetical protein
MPEGHYVFAQVMQHLPLTTFRRCIERYDGERKVKRFSCLDQYLSLAFAQLTWRESLRDIEACLRAQSSKLYHLGFRSTIARNTLANANGVRDWRIYADFAQYLIGIARRLYADDPLALELDNTVYALDSTTIDLCLSVFPWAPFRSTKAAVKLHTLLDLRGNIPSFIFISDGKMHDVNILDQLLPEARAFYAMDRGYVDFERLARLDDAGSFFVTRAKSNLKARRRYSRPVDRLFFKWIKQHLRIKAFFGTSENAVKSQIWIAVSVYVLVAIVKKRLSLPASLYEMLQILSLTLFEKTPINSLFDAAHTQKSPEVDPNQLNLFA